MTALLCVLAAALLLLAGWAVSADRARIAWRTVLAGLALIFLPVGRVRLEITGHEAFPHIDPPMRRIGHVAVLVLAADMEEVHAVGLPGKRDRKSTRLNSSHYS